MTKPYGFKPKNKPKKSDPVENLYRSFAMFHSKQVENHKKVLGVLSKLTDNHGKMNETIDKLSEFNYEIRRKDRQDMAKLAIIAITVASGFLYLSSFVAMIMGNYIVTFAILVPALYLTYMAVRKGYKIESKDPNIKCSPSGHHHRGYNGSQEEREEQIEK